MTASCEGGQHRALCLFLWQWMLAGLGCRSHAGAPAPATPCCTPHCRAGERLKLFRATITVFRYDVPACLFLLPYLVHNVVAHGSDAARAGVQQVTNARK